MTFELSSDSVREGNGNPLQYSCLENPMDGEAWKANHWRHVDADRLMPLGNVGFNDFKGASNPQLVTVYNDDVLVAKGSNPGEAFVADAGFNQDTRVTGHLIVVNMKYPTMDLNAQFNQRILDGLDLFGMLGLNSLAGPVAIRLA